MDFLTQWNQAAVTSVGFFWMAFWAFALGYLLSSLIQVLVTRERMRRHLGTSGARSMALATFFGFISSSCSFSALSTTRALFQKGAGLAPSLAFMLASTNLVVELGIVIAIFLSWQFVVGEYVGGVLLILFVWLFVRLTRPRELIEQARERAGEGEADDATEDGDWRRLLASANGWRRIGEVYVMEWHMVWKDVTIGFLAASAVLGLLWWRDRDAGDGHDHGGASIADRVLAATAVAAFAWLAGGLALAPILG